jgi:hypothetical protein
MSTYGPNSGKRKPGVSADGKSMTSIQYALFTDSMTVTIHRFPSHPLQVDVEIEYTEDLDRSGNNTVVSFQLLDSDPEKRYLCTKYSQADPGNVTFEDSMLSFLGMQNNLRHWAIGDKDDGIRIADYFDHNTEQHEPHSVHFNRNEPDFSELRYIDFNEQLTETQIQEWLDSHFFDKHMYDQTDNTECSADDIVQGVPSQMNAFSEEPNQVGKLVLLPSRPSPVPLRTFSCRFLHQADARPEY